MTKNYDRILVKFPKGTKEQIQAIGETVNGFINEAHNALLENVYKIFYNNINGGRFTYEKLLALWN